jgi:hypothetical protein
MPRKRSKSRSGGRPAKRKPAKPAKQAKSAKQPTGAASQLLSREKRLEIIQENILRTTSAMIHAMQRNDTAAADRAMAEGNEATQLYNQIYALPKNKTWPRDQRLP